MKPIFELRVKIFDISMKFKPMIPLSSNLGLHIDVCPVRFRVSDGAAGPKVGGDAAKPLGGAVGVAPQRWFANE